MLISGASAALQQVATQTAQGKRRLHTHHTHTRFTESTGPAAVAGGSRGQRYVACFPAPTGCEECAAQIAGKPSLWRL